MNGKPNAFYDLVRGRRSVRQFTDENIRDETLARVLEAATWAPSAHNRQPWRFVVLKESGNRQKLAESLGDRLREDRLSDGDVFEEVESDVARSFARITGAAIIIVVCLTMEAMDLYPDKRRSRAEFRMAIQGVAMAGQNLLLAAYAEGLGACWMCAPLFAQEVVQQTLDLPDGWEPQGMILLGHPAAKSRPRGRTNYKDLTEWR